MDPREELAALRRLAELEAKAAGASAPPPVAAEPPMDSTRPENPEYPRRDTSISGLAAEAAKGGARGVMGLPRLLSEALASMEGKRPATPSKGQQMLDRFYEQIRPAQDASKPEQMLGTGVELAAGMAPFASGATTAAKIASVAVPTAGGVVGEQLGGETGKMLGTLAAPLGQSGLSKLTRPVTRSTANKDVARELIENGIPVLPSGADAGIMKRSLEAMGGREHTLTLFRAKAQPALQRLASQATGVPAGQLSHANLDDALQAAWNALPAKPTAAQRAAYIARRDNIEAVKRMTVDADSGIIDVAKAQALKQRGTRLDGPLDTIAKAGSKMYRDAALPPVLGKGTPFRNYWNDYGLFGAIPGVHVAGVGARHYIAGQGAQQSLLKNLSNSPGLFGGVPTPGYTSLGALPLFSQGEQ